MPIELLQMNTTAEALNIRINERLARGDAELLHITPYQDNGRTSNYMVVFRVPELAEASLTPLARGSRVASDRRSSVRGIPVAEEVVSRGGRKTRRRKGRKCRTSRKR